MLSTCVDDMDVGTDTAASEAETQGSIISHLGVQSFFRRCFHEVNEAPIIAQREVERRQSVHSARSISRRSFVNRSQICRANPYARDVALFSSSGRDTGPDGRQLQLLVLVVVVNNCASIFRSVNHRASY